MRVRAREARAPVLLFVYALVLTLISGGLIAVAFGGPFGLPGPSYASLAGLGARLFRVVLYGQAVVVLLTVPVLGGTAIVSEREGKTYDLLVCAPLSGWQLVLGRAVGALLFVALFVFASMPFAGLAFFFGGVTLSRVLLSLLLLLILAFCLACLSVAVSVVAPSTSAAVILSLLLSVLFLVANPGLAAGFWAEGVKWAARAKVLPLLVPLVPGWAGAEFNALAASSVVGAVEWPLRGAKLFGASLPSWLPSLPALLLVAALLFLLAVHALREAFGSALLPLRALFLVALFLLLVLLFGAVDGATRQGVSSALRGRLVACGGYVLVGLILLFIGPLAAVGKAEATGGGTILGRGARRLLLSAWGFLGLIPLAALLAVLFSAPFGQWRGPASALVLPAVGLWAYAFMLFGLGRLLQAALRSVKWARQLAYSVALLHFAGALSTVLLLGQGPASPSRPNFWEALLVGTQPVFSTSIFMLPAHSLELQFVPLSRAGPKFLFQGAGALAACGLLLYGLSLAVTALREGGEGEGR